MTTNRETGADAAPKPTRVRRIDQLPKWLRGDLPDRVRALNLEQWTGLVGAIIFLSREVAQLTSIRDGAAMKLMRRDLLESLEALARDLHLSSLPGAAEVLATPSRAISEVSVRAVIELADSLDDIPVVREFGARLSAARTEGLESQSSVDSLEMVFRDPRERFADDLNAEAAALMETSFEDALAAHEQAWLQEAMREGGLAVEVPVTPPLTRLIEVDLYATEKELLDQFQKWLRAIKKRYPDAVQSKTYGRADFQKWARQGLVPHRMAILWAQLTGAHIPWSVVSDLIGESYGEAVSEAYSRNVAKKNGNFLFSEPMLNTLRAQLRAATGRK